MLVKDLVASFNVVARTEYNKTYREMEPQFRAMAFEYESGFVESVDFPFVDFLVGMEEFTGSRIHNLFPEGYKFTVTNKEYDMSVDIKRKDMERASNQGALNAALKGLNYYKVRIGEMAKQAKDHPYELMFDMLEAGDASTYGTTFDGQNMFDTTHDYSTSAGTQDNIVSGTGGSGYTSASLHADILSVFTRFDSFYYQQGASGNARKRKLNKSGSATKLMIVAPVGMSGILRDLQTKDVLATGETNTLKNSFTYITKNFTDTNDWYAVLLDESTFKPFLYQTELPTELDMPTAQDESARERKVWTWGAYGRYAVAYGSWWKAIQVTN